MLSSEIVKRKRKAYFYQEDFTSLEMWMDSRGKYKEALRLKTIYQSGQGEVRRSPKILF